MSFTQMVIKGNRVPVRFPGEQRKISLIDERWAHVTVLIALLIWENVNNIRNMMRISDFLRLDMPLRLKRGSSSDCISNPTKYSQSLFCPHMSSYELIQGQKVRKWKVKIARSHFWKVVSIYLVMRPKDHNPKSPKSQHTGKMCEYGIALTTD